VVWPLACHDCLLQTVDILWQFVWESVCENIILKGISKSTFISLTCLKWL
jgi:hypothetical protein